MTPHAPRILYLYYRLIPPAASSGTLYAGGAQKRTCQMAEHFSSCGWRVWFGSDDKPDAHIIQRLRSSGIITQQFRFYSGRMRVMLAGGMLAKYIRRHRIELVHCNDRRTAAMMSIVRHYCGCQMVYTARNVFSDKKVTRFLYGENIVAVSGGVRENLCTEFHIPARRITVIHNGTDIQHSTEVERQLVAATWGLGSQDRIVSVIGRLARQKGLEYLLDAVECVRRIFPHLRVLIVGEGEMSEVLRALIRKKGLTHNVLLCGSHASVAPFIDMAEFIVLPSLWEGLPGGAIESIALGKPVVASNVGGLPEVVEHGRNGLLVQPADIKMLADAMLFMLHDRAVVQAMGREARKIAAERFTLATMMSRYEQYYRRIMRPAMGGTSYSAAVT